MSEPTRGSSAPGSWRPERGSDPPEVEPNFQVEAKSRKTPPCKHHIIPHELMVSLTSTVCNKSTLGNTAHHQHCKSCGIRRPDAVWHHPLGRKKYKYFLEQPTSLTGAGRDISFLCDAMVTQTRTTPLPPVTIKNDISNRESSSISESLIPEEYRVVKNKGIRSLEFYEDAFTVQLKDDEQKLLVLPSLRPSGRLEVIQLMRMMDDMLEKAGVDQQSEELTELSQLEGLLELVKVEQNIYNTVFHELIRQVSVGCAERGQLLAKLRHRYQSLLDRIPRRLMALHTEAVAQRALDRRLTEEIHSIKTSIQQLTMELSKIRDHDAFVSQQAAQAHRQLAESLKQSHTNSDGVQGYHELYELQRTRLEAQLLQMTEDRDCWSELTFTLALKVIHTKKLHLVSRLHVSEQSWFSTAEQCVLYLTSKDTEDLNIVMALADLWREKLTAFMAQLKTTEHAQIAQISAAKQDIIKWLSFCTTQNKCHTPKYDKKSVEEIHVNLKDWSKTLALLCEDYQGEKQLCCQQTLNELGSIRERWLNMSFQLFRRHLSPDGEPPRGQQALKELDSVISELLKQLDTQVNGESGIHEKITTLNKLIESWISKIGAVIGRTEKMPASDWQKLENALLDWQRLCEEALHHLVIIQTDNTTDKTKPDMYSEAEKVIDKVQEFKTSLSNFTEGENQKLCEEVSSVHKAQTRWMLDLLILMIPNQSEVDQEQEHLYIKQISVQTLGDDAKMLAEKLDYFSSYITSSCNLILEERFLNPHEDENVMNECRQLQVKCVDWVETCMILLSGVQGGPVELPVKQPELTPNSNDLVCPTHTMETLVKEEVSTEITIDSEVKEIKDEIEAEPLEKNAEEYKTQPQVELKVCESQVVKQISFDGNITQRKLEESSIHLNGTDELLVSPASEEAQKAFSDLTTMALLQQELHDSEVRVNIAEQRALKAEEALQAALEKIQDLERQLHGRPRQEVKSNEENKKTPLPSTPTVTIPTPPKNTTTETKPTSSTKKTRKR